MVGYAISLVMLLIYYVSILFFNKAYWKSKLGVKMLVLGLAAYIVSAIVELFTLWLGYMWNVVIFAPIIEESGKFLTIFFVFRLQFLV